MSLPYPPALEAQLKADDKVVRLKPPPLKDLQVEPEEDSTEITSGLRWILIQRPIEADVYFVGYAYRVTFHWLIHPLFACADADSTATPVITSDLRHLIPVIHVDATLMKLVETVFCIKYDRLIRMIIKPNPTLHAKLNYD